MIPEDRYDRLVFKIHTTERYAYVVGCSDVSSLADRFRSHPPPHGVAELALDMFFQAFHDCLRFPGSHTSPDDLPEQLKKRLSHIHLQKSQLIRGSPHDSLVERIEFWTTTESSIRTVLTTLSPEISQRVRRSTTIYQLGFDSISAVQIGAMLRKLGHQVVASDVIEHPTCESLARYIETRAPNLEMYPSYDIVKFQHQLRSRAVAHGIAMDAVEVVNPCTPLQSAMMAQFIKSGGRDYFNYIDFELEDGVSAANLADAWRVVSSAHPILRTVIAPVEHDDCAFAMFQYPSTMFDISTVVFSQEQTDTFDLWTWREEAARTAAEIPQGRLWSVAIVEAQDKARTMHVAIHHALYDAQSLQMILKDLSTATVGGQLTAKFNTEHAVTAILSQAFGTAESSAEFWRRQADRVVINTFPVLTPLREKAGTILAKSMASTVPLTTLERAASRSGYTLHVILQAAWARVLSAYLGEDSVVFGVVLSGRNTETTRNAAFPCITTLPVIATNSAMNQVLLKQMLQYNTELYKQQHQPLTRIQKWLGCPESRLFDTLLVYQKLPVDLAHSETRPWRVVDEIAGVDYPVSIEIQPRAGDQLRYQISFFGNVLSKDQAVLLLNQFDATVQGLALHPTGEEGDLFGACPKLFSVIPPETPAIPTTVKFLHQFLELRALENPGSQALHFVQGFDGNLPIGYQWTYKELDDNGNRVAQLLLPHTQPGEIVAVYFDKCPEAYFSILGILKAGCAFLALDPGAPRSRNEFILHDSGASALVTSKQREEDLGLDVSVPIIGISETSLALVSANPPILNRNLDPDDVCYCLYTSGTTGMPKGCEVTHDNAVQCMLAFQHIFAGHWQEDSKWLQFASLHFDVSVLEQYWSWSVGITLVAAPRDLILEDLAGTISRLDITHIDLTPSLARLLHPDDAPSLCRGVFITGGESLKQEILDVWGSKGVIYNFYGPTEATIGVTVFPRVPTTGRASNIGRQFLNVGSYVLRPGTEQPVLRGAVGELCVSGRLVGKGYLKREDLTSQKFPTLRAFGERVYRTGDLVRVLHDGCFDFIGRADDQVKLRGQRLEIGEINHAIRTGVDAVEDVATLVIRNEAQLKDLLVSFVVVDDGGKQEGATRVLEIVESPEAVEFCRHVRNACRSRLPGYMIPTYVLQLPFIPLSTNNKAELKELRKAFASLGQEKLMALSSPADKIHQSKMLGALGIKVAKVLAATQRFDWNSVTPESSIFELGVDSISVLRLSRALKSAGFARATPSLILRHPLIGDLVAALEKQKTTPMLSSAAAARQLVRAFSHKHQSRVCSELDVKPDQVEYIAPCSPLQQGMISRSATDGAYFNTFQFELSSGISPESLREGFQRALDTWPILRTKFVSTTDGYVQVAIKKLLLSWSEVGVEASTVDAIQRTRKAWLARNKDSPIQPLEAVLLTGEGPPVLALHIFHGLYDGNSFNLILDRVAGQYLALTKRSAQHDVFISGPSFLDAMCYGPLQDFSTTKAFWLEHIDGTTLDSISDSPPHLAVSTMTRKVSFGVLDALRTSLQVTHQALAQAAWVGALRKHRSSDPIIGVIVSGRNLELDDAENVVGPLFNTLPFRARTSNGDSEPKTTWASLIQQCHDFNTTVLPFQHVPLRDIQKWCSGGKPLFNTLFSFRRQDKRTARQNELWTVVDSEPNTDYPLSLEATLDSEGWLHLLLVGHEDNEGSSSKLLAMMDMLEEVFANMENDPDGWIGGPSVDDDHEKKSHTTDMKGQTVNADKAYRLPASTHPAETPFLWTEEAALIRSEMAALAYTSPKTVVETTPLFGLGLDSIDVIKLSARLKQKGIDIKTGDLLKAQTITAILKHIHAKASHGSDSRTGSHSKDRNFDEVTTGLRERLAGLAQLDPREVVLPTTPLQESMVVEMIASDFQLYFNHEILELAPSVDMEKLKDAWKTVIAGSPILRTRFILAEHASLGASYCQVIGDESEAYMNEANLNSTDELAKLCETATLRARKGAGQGDLLQVVFVSVKRQRFLVLSIAHALYDGWSLDLIHKNVQAAYEERYQPRGLASYVRQVGNMLFPEDGDEHTANFWSEFLRDAIPTMIREREGNSVQRQVVHRDEAISSLNASDIVSFCKANVVTLQTLGQACWAALLASKTQSLDVTFGVVLSCRDTEQLEELVFPTMNTVAVRSVLHGTISSWLRYMQDNMTSINPHQHFPLREAQRLAVCNGPLFNTLFIQQRSQFETCEEEEHTTLVRSVGGMSAVGYPVCIEMEMKSGNLVWRVACDGSYVSRDETSRMLQELDQVLKHILCSPEAVVLAFSGQYLSVCGLAPVILKAPDDMARATTNESESENEAWSSVEETIRDILAEVSGVPAASILKSNNVYHLGLDSISAIKAGSLLRKNGVSVAFRDMLKAGSISELARLVCDTQPFLSASDTPSGGNSSAGGFVVPDDIDLPGILEEVGMDPSIIEAVLPAFPMQVHVLSVWQNTQGAVFYPCFNYVLSGDVDISTIERAWTSLVAEAPILRTTFVSTNSRANPVLQLVLRPPPAQQASIIAARTAETSQAADLSQRYHSFQAKRHGDTWKLQLKIHHALYDAVSLSAIMQRFLAYCSVHEAKASVAPTFDWRNVPSPRQAEANWAARKRFWTEYLSGAESLCPGPQNEERDSCELRVSIVKQAALRTVSPILKHCRAKGVSLQALFFAAYAQFLAAAAVRSGKDKPWRVVFGIYVANRAENDILSTEFYPLLRLVPLCVTLSQGAGLFDVAAEIQRDIHVISARVNLEVGLWEIKDWTGITVHSFVNFLSAPMLPFNEGRRQVQLAVAEDAITTSAADHPGGWYGDGEPSGLASNPVRDVFPVSLPALFDKYSENSLLIADTGCC